MLSQLSDYHAPAMKTIYDLIDDKNFRQKTAMWLDKKSITALRVFINGYEACQYFNDISPSLTPPFHLFLPWVQRLYNYNGSYHNWDGIILQHSDNDEERAFDKFLELVDNFRKLRATTIAATEIINSAAACFLSPKNYDDLSAARAVGGSRLPAADKLFIVEFNKELGCTIYHQADKHIVWNAELLFKLRKRMRLMFREEQWVGTMPSKLS